MEAMERIDRVSPASVLLTRQPRVRPLHNQESPSRSVPARIAPADRGKHRPVRCQIAPGAVDRLNAGVQQDNVSPTMLCESWHFLPPSDPVAAAIRQKT